MREVIDELTNVDFEGSEARERRGGGRGGEERGEERRGFILSSTNQSIVRHSSYISFVLSL